MTSHPVTKAELDIIQNQNHYWNQRTIDTVLARPDPLEVLEKWITKELAMYRAINKYDALEMIEELRTNPDAVIKRGKEEGWL